MILTSLTLKDLFTTDARLTFLAGAGCSIEAPSCLPAGRSMMNAIIKYSCIESEIEKILDLEELRFEQLIEIIRDHLDPNLKIIDYYGQCDTPNLQHFFLAEMILKGHFVMTTNFDFLIEHALLQSGVEEKDILPIITEQDFKNYSNPNELLTRGKKLVYKIHGSTKNIITGQDTRDWLVATIQALGSNKEGSSVFQVQPFQKDAFVNLSDDRSLIVMGYSGSDDFDIIPTLKALKNMRNIIWINHVENDNGSENENEIYEVNTKIQHTIDQLLMEIKKTSNVDKVFRINANTTSLVKQLLELKPDLSSKDFLISPDEWLKDNMIEPDNIMKYYISYKIYQAFNKYEDMMRCSKKVLSIAKNMENQEWRASALINIGRIYQEQSNYTEALEKFEEAYDIDEQLGNLNGKAIDLNNIGRIYQIKGEYSKALEKFEETYEIDKQLGHLKGQANRLNNIGLIYHKQENYPKALEKYEQVLSIFEQLGDLKSRAILLNNIGMIYHIKGTNTKALKNLEESLEINEQLRNFKGIAECSYNIGEICEVEEDYPEALKRYEKALEINEQLGSIKGIADCFNNIGTIYYKLGKKSKALKKLEESLQILIKLGLSKSPEAIHVKTSIENVKSKMK